MISLSSDKSSDFYSSRITSVNVQSPNWKLSGGGLFFAGSCFAENLYRGFSDAGLKAGISPFGNIYNPVSLSSAAGLLSAGDGIEPGDCFEFRGDYYHFMFHTLISGTEPEELSARLNKELESAHNFIQNAEAVVITLGTSFVFKLRATGRVVNNCHRLPAKDFARVILSLSEATDALNKAVGAFLSINPNLKIIISLSPVRHLRDNAAENSLSKATLRCAIDKVCKIFPKNLWYYPSYEIILDELRDYRWYAADLCHPSQEAVSYVISRFIETAYNDNFHKFLAEWMQVRRDLNHKPLRPDSSDYNNFIKKVKEKEKSIAERYPEIMADSGQ
jgi:hypothetical protein